MGGTLTSHQTMVGHFKGTPRIINRIFDHYVQNSQGQEKKKFVEVKVMYNMIVISRQ